MEYHSAQDILIIIFAGIASAFVLAGVINSKATDEQDKPKPDKDGPPKD